MTDPKTNPKRSSAGSPDSLTKTPGVALDESALEKVSGGGAAQITQDITVNKAKTADKSAQATDAYIRQ